MSVVCPSSVGKVSTGPDLYVYTTGVPPERARLAATLTLLTPRVRVCDASDGRSDGRLAMGARVGGSSAPRAPRRRRSKLGVWKTAYRAAAGRCALGAQQEPVRT